jgi:hypothetical protein
VLGLGERRNQQVVGEALRALAQGSPDKPFAFLIRDHRTADPRGSGSEIPAGIQR